MKRALDRSPPWKYPSRCGGRVAPSRSRRSARRRGDGARLELAASRRAWLTCRSPCPGPADPWVSLLHDPQRARPTRRPPLKFPELHPEARGQRRTVASRRTGPATRAPEFRRRPRRAFLPSTPERRAYLPRHRMVGENGAKATEAYTAWVKGWGARPSSDLVRARGTSRVEDPGAARRGEARRAPLRTHYCGRPASSRAAVLVPIRDHPARGRSDRDLPRRRGIGLDATCVFPGRVPVDRQRRSRRVVGAKAIRDALGP